MFSPWPPGPVLSSSERPGNPSHLVVEESHFSVRFSSDRLGVLLVRDFTTFLRAQFGANYSEVDMKEISFMHSFCVVQSKLFLKSLYFYQIVSSFFQ